MAVVVVGLLSIAAPAGADIIIEFDELILGQEGSVRTVAEAKVPADLVGRSCRISVIAENQASVHIGNDVIVSTGDSQAVIVGVEDEANGGTNEVYEVVVGPTIVVDLRFGPDGMSSLGFNLSFDCDQTVDTTAVPALDGGAAVAPESTTTTAVPVTPTSSCSTDGSASDGTGGSVTDPSTDGSAAGASTDGSAGDPSTGGSAMAGCPADDRPTGSQATDTSTTSVPTTTSTAPVIATSTTEAPVALPQTPAASAVVAAPAYAG